MSMTSRPDTPPIDTDALVIGAGPIGLFQVFQLGLQGIQAHVVDALPHVGGQCVQLYGDKPIYDIPGVPVCTGQELVDLLAQQVSPMQAQWHLSQQIAELHSMDDGRWLATTTEGQRFHARTVFIAAGVGAFVPRVLKAEGLQAVLGTHMHYHPDTLAMAAGQEVLVHGGGEEAVAAAIACASTAGAARTWLLHRRDAFQASPALLAQLQQMRDSGAIQVIIGQITEAVVQAGHMQALRWMDPQGETRTLPVQQLLVYLGVSPRMGPVAEWGLAMERKQLVVDPATFATDATGIYAVGDINTYPGKRKLILCGFHEATLAAFAAAEYLQGEKPLLQYTTTSTRLHAILGVHHPQA